MSTLKSLVKDTALYGLSSMFGRFLNWLLTYVYVRVMLPEDFGRMTNLYAWTALLMILLTYGMETAFFRFANKHERPGDVYVTTLGALGSSSALFVLLGLFFLEPLASALQLGTETQLLVPLLFIVATDAFMAIPLGYLRYEQRPWRFTAIRMGFVGFTIVATLASFYGLPWLQQQVPTLLPHWSPLEHPLHYILGINLLGNLLQLLMLAPTLRKARGHFDAGLLKAMLRYAWPMLLLGLAGNFNNQADKILFPLLFEDAHYAHTQLGIYGACYKLAVVMILFTQAFRYAYDPFVFAETKKGDQAARRAYSAAMTYYVLFTLFIFLAVMSYIDLLKLLIKPAYYPGLSVVPWIMLGQLMFGVYFNLSLWYKVTDRTYWGTILSVIGCALTVGIIVLLAPHWGFMACAWASVIANGAVMLVSYLLGQRYYPVRYELIKIGSYSLLCALLYGLQVLLQMMLPTAELVRLGLNSLLLLTFLCIIAYREIPSSALTQLRRRFL